jgi:hypothetical protein
MKYKDDLYGPLSLPLIAQPARAPFPAEYLPQCQAFGEEWRQRAFTKAEFRQALALALQDEAQR